MTMRLDRHKYHLDEQRSEVAKFFEEDPAYFKIKANSERILDKITKEIEGLGLNETNCLFAVDGSFSFGMGRENSDIDGVLYLIDGSIQKEQIDGKLTPILENLHLTSNIRLFSETEFPASDDERVVALCMLVSGRYTIGDFDEGKVSSLAERMGVEDILDHALDERFNRFWDETVEKYKLRLKAEKMSSKPETE